VSSGNLGVRSCLLAGELPSLPSLFPLAIAFLEDDLFQALQLVGGGDVSDRGMQPDRVVVRDKSCDSAPGFILNARAGRANALALKTAMPALQCAVGLGVVGTGPDTRRHCQDLCSEEYGSGGVSELENSVGEDLPFEEGEDQGGGIEFAPVLGR